MSSEKVADVKAGAAGAGAAAPVGLATPTPDVGPTPRTRIYYNPELSKFSLGADHPMVPHRLHLTHRLAELWGLYADPAVQVVSDYPPATTDQLRRFHTDEYVAFLEYLDSLDLQNMSTEEQQELLGDDLALFGLSVCRPTEAAPSQPSPPPQPQPPQRPPPKRPPPPPQPPRPPPAPPPQRPQPAQPQPPPPAPPAPAQSYAANGHATVEVKAEAAEQAAPAAIEVKKESDAPASQPEPTSQPGPDVKAESGGKPPLPTAPSGSLTTAPSGALTVVPSPSAAAQRVPTVTPQLYSLATKLLQQLAPMGTQPLNREQEQQLVQYLIESQKRLQQQYALQAALPAAARAAAPPRPAAAGGQKAQQGGSASAAKKRKAGGGGGKSKRKSRRRNAYSDDDEEDEDMVEDDDDDDAAADGIAAAAVAAPVHESSRPSRRAATAVAALANAVAAAEAEPTESESGSEEEEEDDDEGGDCPIFPGLLRYVGLQAAGSILAARDLAAGRCDVAVHWGGGMHHGMPYRAYGFCYVNDLVLAVLELMAKYSRVLYIDIDIHHGDGVEHAFKRSERVLSISLHKWDDGRMQAAMDTLTHGSPRRAVFFPGTGKKNDLGESSGRYYTVNVPLQDNIMDESYLSVYEAVVRTAFERFRPQAVVLQCGCDSVAGDKLGRFNLSIRGHSKCVEVVRELCRRGPPGAESTAAPDGGGGGGASGWRVPLLVTGGGGYTPPLVARCWAFETAVLLGRQLGEAMPPAVAQAPDLADLGPSYFRDPSELSRPPAGPYCMCLDTTWRPSSHKQMDSDGSLQRLTAYLVSNMQRMKLPDGVAPAKPALPAPAAAGGAAGAAEAGTEGAAAAGADKDKQEAAAKPPAPAPAAKARRVVEKDPTAYLTPPAGYPDAAEYVRDQQDRRTAGAPWAAKIPPPQPNSRSKRPAGGAAASRAAAAAAAPAPAGGSTPAAPAPASKGGRAAAAPSPNAAAAAAAGTAGAAGAAGAASRPAAGPEAAQPAAAGAAALSVPLTLYPVPPAHPPGLPVIFPYVPKRPAAAAGQAQ